MPTTLAELVEASRTPGTGLVLRLADVWGREAGPGTTPDQDAAVLWSGMSMPVTYISMIGTNGFETDFGVYRCRVIRLDGRHCIDFTERTYEHIATIHCGRGDVHDFNHYEAARRFATAEWPAFDFGRRENVDYYGLW